MDNKGAYRFRFKRGMILLIITILSSIILTADNFIVVVQTIGTSDDYIKAFLEKNHKNIELSDTALDSGFDILDSDVCENDVILCGEAHAVKGNFDLQLALIEYLNQKFGIRYLLAEIGYSSACLTNQYLETGDKAKLDLIYAELEGTAAWSRESYDFWVRLREYHIAHPKNARIQVIGIDIEHQLKTACEYLQSMLPESPPPQEIEFYMGRIANCYNNENSLDSFKKYMIGLQKDMNTNSNLYKRYLENDYFDFSLVVDNIINSINAYAAGNDFNKFAITRETSICSNFNRLYTHLPAGKYFGQFGMWHVFQKTGDATEQDGTRLAKYLNSSDASPVKGKVLSIAYGYENCYYRNAQKKYAEYLCDPAISDINVIDQYCKSGVTIFKLNGENSPFNISHLFVSDMPGGHTTGYFQYIILLKNSKSVTPVGKPHR